MNIMKIRAAICMAVLFVISVVARGQTVSVNFNQSQSFAGYHTYVWGGDNANQIKDSILAQAAQSDINAALQGKGLTMVAAGQPADLIVTVSGGLRQQTSYTAMGMRGWGGGMGSITPEQNVIGTMIVDLFDAKTQSLVWRGLGQNTLSNNGNKNQQMVHNAVVKMFKQWPKS
jgi:hypothetical protein